MDQAHESSPISAIPTMLAPQSHLSYTALSESCHIDYLLSPPLVILITSDPNSPNYPSHFLFPPTWRQQPPACSQIRHVTSILHPPPLPIKPFPSHICIQNPTPPKKKKKKRKKKRTKYKYYKETPKYIQTRNSNPMGICSSCEATAVGPAFSGKLILADGQLREFDRPIKVSTVVDKNSNWFVCDADEMEFDGVLTAVGSNEELMTGQIYFVLPSSMLKRPLQAEDLAALAVKASVAIGNGRLGVGPLSYGKGGKNLTVTVTERRRRRRRGGSGDFIMDLSAIPE